ncbi:CHAP domain-containing protein, partial [uncultured Eubacterium sp.]|uniref:CHAP domain-containing protein n=1 Tax=uncultured Eubacterium sp. TaxID=165185 RepID=UPI002596EA29
AVIEINEEYQSRLDEEKASIEYDVLEMSGSKALWKEVLAVYSVKVNTDDSNPQEVATMNNEKKELLKDIFWQMNEISSNSEIKIETITVEKDDGKGNIITEEQEVTQTYLYIDVSHKSVEDMIAQYNFDNRKQALLLELLDDKNNSLWSSVLYGITTSSERIVNVALSQVGNVGGQPYWSWYGFNSRVEWCACFVSWCANECGYIETGVIPKFAGVVLGIDWFKTRGQWANNSIEPSPGSIIFFDWQQDGLSDHVGIVEKCENGIIYTIEGNSTGDSCRQREYFVGSSYIYGYGLPAY